MHPRKKWKLKRKAFKIGIALVIVVLFAPIVVDLVNWFQWAGEFLAAIGLSWWQAIGWVVVIVFFVILGIVLEDQV